MNKPETLLEQLALTINGFSAQPPLSDWKMELEEEPGGQSYSLLLSCRVSGVSGDANVPDLPQRLERRIKGLDADATHGHGEARLRKTIEQLGRSMRTELAMLCGHIDLAGQPISKEPVLLNDPNDPEVAEIRPPLRV